MICSFFSIYFWPAIVQGVLSVKHYFLLLSEASLLSDLVKLVNYHKILDKFDKMPTFRRRLARVNSNTN